MLFVLFILVFVGCACVVVPLVTFGICAAKDRNARVRRERDRGRFSLLPTDGVR
jgi:hypothetical protein